MDGVITSYVYNTEDRLAQVWNGLPGSGTLTASYYYDPFGRRLWKDVGGTKTYYHYADEGLVAEIDASGNVVKSYGWQPGGTWGTDPLFMKSGGSYYFYHNDHLGTPQKMTARSGEVVWSATYEAFGKAEVDANSTVVNNLRFPGQYYDAETGLHYNMWRYYEPVTGRYLRTDPIGFGGLNPNLYGYVFNTPVNLIDPNGLYAGVLVASGGVIANAACSYWYSNSGSPISTCCCNSSTCDRCCCHCWRDYLVFNYE